MNLIKCGFFLFASILSSAVIADELPLYSQRLSPGQVSASVWREMNGMFKRHPRSADEVWFSTGVTYPTMDWHHTNALETAVAAADLRKLGIVPSLQVQVTLGHGSVRAPAERWAGKNWTGFTGWKGGESACSACPRDERFLSYISESTALYATFHPAWVWIDDDLRPMGHGNECPWVYAWDARAIGCWCERCVAGFSAREGVSRSRDELAEAVHVDASLAARWDTYVFEGLAGVAERIAASFHKISPETRFGLQHCPYFNSNQTLIFKALFRATGGQTVGSRPGGGWYQDHSFYGQILKVYFEMKQRSILGEIPEIGLYTPEIESAPRVFSSRSGRSVVLEALAALTMGMDTLSIYLLDCRAGRSETAAFYERRYLPALDVAEPMLRELRRHTHGARPSGLVSRKPYPNFNGFEQGVPEHWQITTGIPIVMGPAHVLGEIDIESISSWASSSERLMNDYARADESSGGRLAVLPAEPLQGWLMPRTLPDGTLKSVTFVNTTLDASWPTKLWLRGVPQDVVSARWRALDGQECECSVTHDKSGRSFVVLPVVQPWNGGWLAF